MSQPLSLRGRILADRRRAKQLKRLKAEITKWVDEWFRDRGLSRKKGRKVKRHEPIR